MLILLTLRVTFLKLCEVCNVVESNPNFAYLRFLFVLEFPENFHGFCLVFHTLDDFWHLITVAKLM